MGNIIGCRKLADGCYGNNDRAENNSVEIGAGGFQRSDVQNNDKGRFIAIEDREIELGMVNPIIYNDIDIIVEAQMENAVLRPDLIEIKNKITNTIQVVVIIKEMAVVQCDWRLYCLIDDIEEGLYKTLSRLARLDCLMQEIDAF